MAKHGKEGSALEERTESRAEAIHEGDDDGRPTKRKMGHMEDGAGGVAHEHHQAHAQRMGSAPGFEDHQSHAMKFAGGGAVCHDADTMKKGRG